MATYQSEAAAIAAIKAHPVCADYIETPTTLVVFYPSTYTVPGGVSVPIGLSKLDSLNLLYSQMDTFWQAQRLQIGAR